MSQCEANPNMNWPKKSDVAFKPSAIPEARSRVEAFVMPTDGKYLVGFQRAADMIVDLSSVTNLVLESIDDPGSLKPV